jgi:uncharacterized protein YndB with AHSA1/START domain
MDGTAPQLSISRVFDAPRQLVYRAFTDPDQVAQWWGPIGDQIPRDEMEFDIRPGGYQRWTEIFPADPDIRVRVLIDLTAVADGELLEGVIHVRGRLPGGFEPFETRFRIEFHDEPEGRTRLDIRQWLPPEMASPSDAGWAEAFTKLDALLARIQADAGDGRAGAAWRG